MIKEELKTSKKFVHEAFKRGSRQQITDALFSYWLATGDIKLPEAEQEKLLENSTEKL